MGKIALHERLMGIKQTFPKSLRGTIFEEKIEPKVLNKELEKRYQQSDRVEIDILMYCLTT